MGYLSLLGYAAEGSSPTNSKAVHRESDLSPSNTELPILGSSKYALRFQKNGSDMTANYTRDQFDPLHEQHNAFPESEFQKFRRQRAADFLAEWAGNSTSQKFTSAFYSLWHNVQDSKLSRLGQLVRRRELGVVEQCLEMIKQAGKSEKKSTAKTEKTSYDHIQRRLRRFKQSKFKFASFHAKYKRVRPGTTKCVSSRTSIASRPSLRSLLQQQQPKRGPVKPSESGMLRRKKPRSSINYATFDRANLKKVETRCRGESGRMELFRSANRCSGLSKDDSFGKITGSDVDNTSLSSLTESRITEQGITNKSSCWFIANTDLSDRDVTTSPNDTEHCQSLGKLSKLLQKLASRSVHRAFAKLNKYYKTCSASLEVVETQDFSRQMNKIIDFSQAIAEKCGRLEPDKASFSEDKKALMGEINQLLFYVKNNLLRFDQQSKHDSQAEDILESPLLSRAGPGMGDAYCTDIAKQEAKQLSSAFASTRNSSAVDYSPSNLQPKSPCNLGSDNLDIFGSIQLPKNAFWEATESSNRIRSLGESRTIEDDLNFEAQRSLRETILPESSRA